MDFPVAEIIQHQEFVEATYANDIAILRLEKPTTFNSYIWPICLPPRRKDFEDVYAVVAGWGQLYYSGPLSHVLLQVAVPVWPHQKCVDAFIQTITDDNLCAAAYEGGKDSCLVSLVYFLIEGSECGGKTTNYICLPVPTCSAFH